ncbi:sensor histidine kinase [Paenibacillus melissococcoides]|uniref:Signal transduction histidine-protein kinase/phosphatase DegS n=1 Tax=Paenibacillus melissococcoides TaxID=2912268 RepID=A0ABM9G9X8_9BACL|nr:MULTISPECIES: sensor histidine kinase [Paenibacillus]MEB9897211.1 sensor histidine kinase [Bacillus cereus]CAH8248752.1 sensor histidine kinase [Paenibacillus melissococcoides]CAH8713836.1 sensor histidine kinase [Paenibacillus melissococcoides]CAH8720396.1 sensor histidine kinase [Paenibacillus melissococcoides]GIO78433.1 signal transduction histidine-protein kinase/phosphatase DegS [Paenibacillus dendritiformis]
MDYQVGNIDRVIKNAIKVMEESKYQIFEILDSSRNEAVTMSHELQEVLNQTAEICDKVDELERKYRLARLRLTEVSRDFVRYTEEDIKLAYEKATQLQLELMIYREKEGYLKTRRDDLQNRLRAVEGSIERAETIGSQMSVALEYLSGDLGQVTRILESAKNRQLLGLKIILAQEEERKRIAREIHDGPAQSLANLVLRTEIVERMISKQDFQSVKHEIVDLRSQVRFGLEEIRKIIYNLRPMALDDLGLVPTLRKFIHDYEEKNRIRTSFEIRGHERRLKSAMEAAIYRLVQEAFTNAAKHGHPTNVTCELTYEPEEVRVVVRDNGYGFKLDSLEVKSKEHMHFGLLGMKERVELLEGHMEIYSAENRGTRIVIQIPTNVEKREE